MVLKGTSHPRPLYSVKLRITLLRDHEYIITEGENTVILDYTSKGILWNPSKNLWIYELSPEDMTLKAV